MRFQEENKTFTKYSNKITYSYVYNNLYIASSVQLKLLVNKICNDRKGGNNFRENLLRNGELLGKGIKELFPDINMGKTMILGIPRGGVPLAQGLKKELNKATLCYTNDALHKEKQKELIQDNEMLENADFIIVTDTVIDLGATAERTFKYLYEKHPNKIYILASLITSYDGAYKLENMFPLLKHFTSHVETKVQWIKSTAQFNRRIIPVIGDVGELSSKAE